MTTTGINHPQKLVELYRRFYRADKKYNPSVNATIKPFQLASQVLLNADTSMRGETLILVIAAKIHKLMNQIHQGHLAQGRWMISDLEQERQAILDFARYFIVEVFEKSFNGDLARLAGKQLGFLEDTCELLYRLEQDKENASAKSDG